LGGTGQFTHKKNRAVHHKKIGGVTLKEVLLGFLIFLLLGCGIAGYIFWSMGDAEFWESSIRKFEESDRVHPPKPGTIVFTGSSSINFWRTLADAIFEMAPFARRDRNQTGKRKRCDQNSATPRDLFRFQH
jgi:hypothetical protein